MMTRDLRALAIGAAIAVGALLAYGPARAEDTVLKWGDNLPQSIDPHAVYDVPAGFSRLNAYDTLLRYEGNPPEIKPWLALSYTTSADSKDWLFQLRQGVKFHD